MWNIYAYYQNGQYGEAYQQKYGLHANPSLLLQQWTLPEMRELEKGLRLLSATLGHDMTRTLTSGGVIARPKYINTDGLYCNNPANSASACLYGYLHGLNYKYAILLARGHDLPHFRFTVVHEYGHRVARYLDQQGIARRDWLDQRMQLYAEIDAVSGYGTYNAPGEYWAEAFAAYIWELNVDNDPPVTGGGYPPGGVAGIINPDTGMSLKDEIRMILSWLR